MKALLRIIMFVLLLIVTNQLIGQNSFTIRYHIKFIGGKGKLLSCESLAKDSIYVYTFPGYLAKNKYEDSLKSVYFEINTIWPVFTLIWKRNDRKMAFTIDCATEYKDIYLDSLYFKAGSYLVRNNCEKHIKTEDDKTRHIIFSDYSAFKQDTDFIPEKKEAIYNINCR